MDKHEESSLERRLFAVAERQPQRIALRLPDQQDVDYGRLVHWVRAVAGGLNAAGVGAGDRVALYCGNGAEFVAAYFGILAAGAVVVPINLLSNAREIRLNLQDCEAKWLLYAAPLQAKVAAMEGLAVTAMPIAGEPQGAVEVLPSLVDEPARHRLAVIIYTSGTTGRAKGAMLSHGNLLANTASVYQALSLQSDDCPLVVLPMFHAFAATAGMLTPLLHGLSLAPVAGFDPQSLGQALVACKATLFFGVPSMYALLLRLDDAAVAPWRQVRFLVSGGAALPTALLRDLEQRFGVPVLEGDGPTECSPVTCVNPRFGERRPGSVGLPVPRVEMRILDAEGRAVADGEMGEVCVRGDNVMLGYWNRPEDTRDAFFEAGWFRTGDLGYRDQDGYFYLVDRIKDLVIVNGMNVYPRMVEEVLYQHPQVAEAAVVGERHLSHGEILVAYLVAKQPGLIQTAQLRAFCREHLGNHQVPRRFEVRDSLPKNATGKVLKRELRRQGEIERGVLS